MADISRLPAPRADDWEWQTRGACRGLDSATFFHPENERGPSRVRREQLAKEVCGRCQVAQTCLSWALRTREPYGVWGGKSTEERDALIRLSTV
ncbi:MAG: WhiB family transcriptional regulator, redox-sensing transcriptional regulator [Pseudonocardiales bacterium]|nr:WhiB family transcriptional regulator, redox-sensing transcriptional regulator [Pseudonocardiales bacterium]